MDRLITENPEKERKELMKQAAINWNKSKADASGAGCVSGVSGDADACDAE